MFVAMFAHPYAVTGSTRLRCGYDAVTMQFSDVLSMKFWWIGHWGRSPWPLGSPTRSLGREQLRHICVSVFPGGRIVTAKWSKRVPATRPRATFPKPMVTSPTTLQRYTRRNTSNANRNALLMPNRFLNAYCLLAASPTHVLTFRTRN